MQPLYIPVIMAEKEITTPTKETRLHPRNKNREQYDLAAMIESQPELKEFIVPNKKGEDSVDFADPRGVRALNTAILKHYYKLDYWDFAQENLCPPIPGRADYIHYMADLLCASNFGTIPKGEKIVGLDVGVGANCIYPIIGVLEYGWKFIGTDVDPGSLNSSDDIVNQNEALKGQVDFRMQDNPRDILYGVMNHEDKFDFSVCNPPFHSSAEIAKAEAQRKVSKLKGKKIAKPLLNFAGLPNELIYDGGELKFIQKLGRESEKFGKNCYWFSSLVSKHSNLKAIVTSLKKLNATEIKTIPMGTGNKTTRILAWSFLSKEEQMAWKKERWA
ncbi:MAG: 23S rRNA (adenine1618-N6)-methyltransferase [Luteibaculaceae bacterium]